jgi:DnaD/phage-associated family protein
MTGNGYSPRFRGFPIGARATLIPNLFFSDVLPAIDEPAELIVSMYLFFALGRRRPGARVVTRADLAADPSLRRALARLPGGADAALDRGLTGAVARGIVLRVGGQHEPAFAINSVPRRPAHARGAGDGGPVVTPAATEPTPSIYALYEEAIGTISPLIADELRAAEEEYPADWIESAFREAAAHNKRSWRYVARILERWRDEGRHDATPGRDSQARRNLAGRWRDLTHR